MINPPRAVGRWRSETDPTIELQAGSTPRTYKLVVGGRYLWLKDTQVYAVAALLVDEIERRRD